MKKELEPLVGTWRARALVLTSVANPEIKVKLIQDWNATFTMSVLATGQYSASLAAFGQSNTEAGTIEVSGDQVTITPTSPPGPSTTGTFSIQAKVLVVDGQTQYDFSWGTEDALVHMELEQVES